MRTPPFYANHEDGMRCMLSVYNSIIAAFEGEPQSWEDLIELTGYETKRPSWTIEAIVKLRKRGYKIRMVENFDYSRFLDEGEAYLRSHMDEAQANWIIKNSNLDQLKANTPEFLKLVDYENRSPQLSDIDSMLEEKMLVNVQLNSRRLNGLDGHSSHAILVYGKDDNYYYCHDPGLPPRPERTIPRALMLDSMGGVQNTTEVTGYKKS